MYRSMNFSENAARFMNKQRQFRLVKMDIVPCAGFVPQARHRMRIHLTGDNVIGNDVMTGIANGDISDFSMSKLASSVMSLDASSVTTPDIVGGWGSQRMIWYMEMDVISQDRIEHMMLTGYTDPSDRSFGGHLDPNMRLITISSQVYETSNRTPILLASDNIIHPDAGSPIYTMRPNDIARTISMDASFDTITTMPMSGMGVASSVLTTTASNNRNASGSSWLTKMLKSERDARLAHDANDLVDTADGPSAYWQNVASHCMENSVRDHSLLGANTIVSNEMVENAGAIRLGVLDKALGGTGDLMDPTRSSVVFFHEFKNRNDAHGNTMESDNWSAGRVEALSASAIRSTASYVVMENLLQVMSFAWDTKNPAGLYDPHDFPEHLRPYGLSVTGVTGWSDKATPAFKRNGAIRSVTKIMNEVGPMITSNGTRHVHGFCEVDVLGAITVWIQYEGGQAYQYKSPAFGSTALLPCVSSRPDATKDMADNYAELRNYISEAANEHGGQGVVNNVKPAVPHNNLFN